MHDLATIVKMNAKPKPGKASQKFRPDNARSLPDYIADVERSAEKRGYNLGHAALRAALADEYTAPLHSIAATLAHTARNDRERDSAALLVRLADHLDADPLTFV